MTGWFHMRGVAAAVIAAALSSGCGGTGDGGQTASAGVPARGGTLKIIGNADVDHLSTSSAYYTPTNSLLRGMARQLVTYPPDTNFDRQARLVPDLATVVPTLANGGISPDGRTYTFHLRSAAKWNTTPPRQVTAADEVRGIKLLCNPVSPTGAPGYYESTIVGMDAFCHAFAKVNGLAPDIKAFVNSHEIPGLAAPNDSTVVFSLLAPASDFLNILALPFASPMPVEYLDYVPDGPEARTHTISDGPYQITHYVPNREIELHRSPAWDSSADPFRKAYVDSIEIIEGVGVESVQQQIQAGTADMSWDQVPPTADLATLLAANDPDLVLGLAGDHFVASLYLPINLISPNAGGALRNLKVRQALEYAVDKTALTQVYGGPQVAQPMNQAVVSAAGGFAPGYDPYPTPGSRGDSAKARALLTEAGYPNGITVKLLYRTYGMEPQAAQTVQASLQRGGFTVQLVPATGSDFFAKYLQNPDNAKRGVWDLAVSAWIPDWFGNNGRTAIEVPFDGRTFGPNTTDYGDYNSAAANALMDQAIHSLTEAQADTFWVRAAARVMEDAVIVPLIQQNVPIYHSSRLRNCIYWMPGLNCDITQVWIQGARR